MLEGPKCPVCNQPALGMIPYVGGARLYAHRRIVPVDGFPYFDGCFQSIPDAYPPVSDGHPKDASSR